MDLGNHAPARRTQPRQVENTTPATMSLCTVGLIRSFKREMCGVPTAQSQSALPDLQAARTKRSRLWPAGTLCITIAANIAETGILKLEACFPDSVVGFIAEQGHPTTEYVPLHPNHTSGLDRT